MYYLDGHHSGNDWTGDADVPAVFNELDKDVHLKEQLCNDKVCTSIHLLLQMLQIFLVRWTVWMTSWIAYG